MTQPEPTEADRLKLTSEWVQPWWRSRGLRQPNAAAAGRRAWTLLGSVDGSSFASVDRRGLVGLPRAGLSLDWWLRAGASWEFPSMRSGVRQQLLEHAPVVETSVALSGGGAGGGAGGDVSQRVFVARAAQADGDGANGRGGDELVMEIRNDTGAAIAVAVALRPYDLQGLGRIDEIAVSAPKGGGCQVVADGFQVLRADVSPGAVVLGSGGVDPARLLAEATKQNQNVRCQLGLASVALVFPLVHTSVLRVAAPLRPPARAQKAAPPGLGSGSVGALPDAERVAAGWRQQSEAALRATLVPGRLASIFEVTKTSLPLAVRDAEVISAPLGPPTSVEDDATLLTALAQAGHSAAVLDVLVKRGDGLGRRGDIIVGGADLTASTLIAAALYLSLYPTPALATGFAEVAARGARWLLAQADLSAAQTQRALSAAQRLLELAPESKPARKAAKQLRLALDKKLRKLGVGGAGSSRTEAAPATTTETGGAPASVGAMVGLLVANASGSGNDLVETARRARSEIAAGEATGIRRLEALATAASDTWAWPTIADPRPPDLGELEGSPSGSGSQASSGSSQPASQVARTPSAGHDLRVSALVFLSLREMLVSESTGAHDDDREDAGEGAGRGSSELKGDGAVVRLAVAKVWPEVWRGSAVEVHGLATSVGRLSWALRWHGERPALLWELEPHDQLSQHRIELSAPGLDPDFSSQELSGEALLSAMLTPSPRTEANLPPPSKWLVPNKDSN